MEKFKIQCKDRDETTKKEEPFILDTKDFILVETLKELSNQIKKLGQRING